MDEQGNDAGRLSRDDLDPADVIEFPGDVTEEADDQWPSHTDAEFEEASYEEEEDNEQLGTGDDYDDEDSPVSAAAARSSFKMAVLAVGGFLLLFVGGTGYWIYSQFGGSGTPAGDSVSTASLRPAASTAGTAAVARETAGAPATASVDPSSLDVYDFGNQDGGIPASPAGQTRDAAPAVPPASLEGVNAASTREAFQQPRAPAATGPGFEDGSSEIPEIRNTLSALQKRMSGVQKAIAGLAMDVGQLRQTVTTLSRQAQSPQPASRQAAPDVMAAVNATRAEIAALERRLETVRRAAIDIHVDRPRGLRQAQASGTPLTRQTGGRRMIFRAAQPDVVWLAYRDRPNDLLEFRVGEAISGLGRLKRIGLAANGRWYIETEGGRITEFDE